jgi:hypothetical protein
MHNHQELRENDRSLFVMKYSSVHLEGQRIKLNLFLLEPKIESGTLNAKSTHHLAISTGRERMAQTPYRPVTRCYIIGPKAYTVHLLFSQHEHK